MAANSMFDVTGKHAIVTGAARGIGCGVAEIYLENGCKVVLIDNRQELLKETVANFRSKGYDAYGVVGDLSVVEEVDRVFAESMELLGGVLDILCPCAGMQHRSAPEDFPIDKFIEIQNVNVLHLFRMSQLAIKVMLKQEGRGNGKFILMGSLGAFTAGHNIVAYNTSKGAVAMMTRSLAESCASRGINVNCICPGYVATDILKSMDPERYAAIASKIPAGRIGTIDDMKGPALFLASSASDWIHGDLILADGGQGAIH